MKTRTDTSDIVEMIHRESIRLPLLIHHLLMIFAIVWVVFCLDQVQHPSLITTAEVWLFQATLEQVVFLGLLSCTSQPLTKGTMLISRSTGMAD
jgi:hypothetical protein